jgi:DNA-binding NarL/FixJ family response regulator
MTNLPVGPQPLRLLVADSSQMPGQLLISALRRRSEFAVTSCGLDSEAILEILDLNHIDVAILATDHAAHNGSQLAVLRRVHRAHPTVAKILLTEAYDRDVVINAFRSGARGLFSFADGSFGAFCKCIRTVSSGRVWATAQQLQYLLDVVTHVPVVRVVNASGQNLLTRREEQVVALVAEGLCNREIARELGLSEHTIKKYLFRIFDKLGISSRVELVLYAVNHSDCKEAEWLAGAS